MKMGTIGRERYQMALRGNMARKWRRCSEKAELKEET
jgi:hypothetical protein